MNGFLAFLSKEIIFLVRSQRVLITLLVFVLLGLMNAPLAYYTPEILKLAGAGDLAVAMNLAQPTALDAWMQYFGNVGQMGILTVLLLCGSLLSGERGKGTLVLPLTKGLGRSGVVIVKFIAMSGLWTLGMLVSAATSAAYTLWLFPGDDVSHLLPGIGALWLLGMFLLALILPSSVMFRGSFGGLILPGAVLLVLGILSAFPDLTFWSPLNLGADSLLVIARAKEVADLLVPSLVAALTVVGCVVVSVVLFRKSAV
jgi:ABC-2 type transport system permease protein